ncbi:hypothetical protein [Corynebacterium falsenii]|uniref:hypothetical protein n=1 Tax=Corynebacterium falsenii TaxID=108486 RepID=UPI001D725FE5|nr:hypothetical protein [Corynebacterium falsenii]HJF12062.1 hypothetical protein [Corynebacterium falsenii]
MSFKNNRFAKAAVAAGAGIVMMLGGTGIAAAQPAPTTQKIQYTPYEAPYLIFSCRAHPEMLWCR